MMAKSLEVGVALVQSKFYAVIVLTRRSTNLTVSNEFNIPGKLPKWESCMTNVAIARS